MTCLRSDVVFPWGMYLRRVVLSCRVPSPSMSYRCSDAGICGMVSERQAGSEYRTDAVGSEGAVEILAATVLSMEMLSLTGQ